jgi:hypothetical protein
MELISMLYAVVQGMKVEIDSELLPIDLSWEELEKVLRADFL